MQEHGLLPFAMSLRVRIDTSHTKARWPWQTDSGHNSVCIGPACLLNLCQLCAGCEHGDQVGTHLHRFFCPVTQHQVRNLAVGSVTCWTISMAAFSNTVLLSAVFAPPVVPTRPDSDFGTFVWHAWQIIPAGCVVYTDGSLIDAKLLKLLDGHSLHSMLMVLCCCGVWSAPKGRQHYPRR